MKFHVHTFRELRITYLVEADSPEEAHQKVVDDKPFDNLPEVARELTDEYTTRQVLVDPITADGEVDYDNSQWIPPMGS